jgi:hypothetical protein
VSIYDQIGLRVSVLVWLHALREVPLELGSELDLRVELHLIEPGLEEEQLVVHIQCTHQLLTRLSHVTNATMGWVRDQRGTSTELSMSSCSIPEYNML